MKISICIPTFNRCNQLRSSIHNLINIVPQDQLDLFEICVSDNASSDGTQEMLNDLKVASDLDIRISINDENIGAPRNFIKAASLAEGDFIWLMGSDDYVTREGLQCVLDQVSKHDCELYLGDRYLINSHGKTYGVQYWSNQERLVDKTNLSGYIKSCNSIGGIFSFLSSIIVSREQWQQSMLSASYNKYETSPYIHVYLIIEIMKRGGQLKYLHFPIVKATTDDDSFLRRRYFNRIKIDYEYISIFNDVFSNDEIDSEIRAILKRERGIQHLLKAKLMIFDTSELNEFYDFVCKYYPEYESVVAKVPDFLISIMVNAHSRARNLKRIIVGFFRNDQVKI